MPPLPVITDCVRVALLWHNAFLAKDAVNVMHFRAPGKTLAQCFTALDNRVAANMWGSTTVDTQAITATLTPLDGSSASLVQPITPAAKWAGAAVTGDIVPQVAQLVKFVTAKRGRSYRGRIFVPFVAEAQQSSGSITAGTVTNANTAWAAFVSNMAGDGVHLGVASYAHSTIDDVTSATCETKTATQRRRQFR